MLQQPESLSDERENTVPQVVQSEGASLHIAVDPERLVDTMRELGVSEQGITDTTIYLDTKSRFQTFGTHYPNKIGRLRFRSNPELQKAEGDIVRLSIVMKGKPRTPEEINRTLVHELEHRAQQDRSDRNLTQGHIAIYGLAIAGLVIGNRIGEGKVTNVMGAVVGAGFGHSIGYLIAPHERQARTRARNVTSSAVKSITQ
ncbi:MAG: hypothetical protein NVS1B7_0550 [Candidatus Saccharimonadales bacterium]